jgi:hypothetical protein
MNRAIIGPINRAGSTVAQPHLSHEIRTLEREMNWRSQHRLVTTDFQ